MNTNATLPASEVARPSLQPPQPGAVLVVERWNRWVRVLDPVTQMTSWIDLDEVGFETVEPPRAD